MDENFAAINYLTSLAWENNYWSHTIYHRTSRSRICIPVWWDVSLGFFKLLCYTWQKFNCRGENCRSAACHLTGSCGGSFNAEYEWLEKFAQDQNIFWAQRLFFNAGETLLLPLGQFLFNFNNNEVFQIIFWRFDVAAEASKNSAQIFAAENGFK